MDFIGVRFEGDDEQPSRRWARRLLYVDLAFPDMARGRIFPALGFADLRAEVLAERSNMSLRNFYRAFTEATGHSPGDWVEASRMEVAKRLLEQTDQNADQIAYKAGFTSYERMRRTFIRKVGASPLAYRTRNTRQTDVEPRLLSA